MIPLQKSGLQKHQFPVDWIIYQTQSFTITCFKILKTCPQFLPDDFVKFPPFQKTTDNNDVFISRRGHKRGHNELSNAECSSNGSQSDNAQLSSSSRHRQTLNPKTRHRMVLNDSEDVHLSDDSEDNDDDVRLRMLGPP